MRLPRMRLSIRRMVMAVAIIALDFGLIRGAYEADARSPCVSHLTLPALFFVAPLSLLTIAAVNAGLGLWRLGRASPFTTGYLLLGGLASLGVSLDLAAETYLLLRVTIDRDPAPVPEPSSFGWVGDVLDLAIFPLSQVAIAMIGGGLAARFGLAFVLSGRAAPFTGQETVSGDVGP